MLGQAVIERHVYRQVPAVPRMAHVQLGSAIVETSYRPDSVRRFSVDLNRPGAYWRALDAVEQKIDFAAMEIADGEAITRSRMRLGLILAAQMTKLIEMTRAPSLTSAQLSRIELPFLREAQNEFFRLAARAYWDGAQVFDRAAARSAQMAGRRIPPRKIYGLSAVGLKRLEAKAAKRGSEFCDAVRRQIQPVLDDVFTPDGIRQKPQAHLEGEIRTVYSKWIDVAPEGPTVQLAMPPLDAVTEADFGKWEGKAVPVTAWMKITADGITKSNQPIPQLRTDATALYVETERTRQINAGITAAGNRDGNVVAWKYTAIRDGKTCPRCRQRDGIVADKNDDFWVFNVPPLHYRCRCHRVPIFAWEPAKYSTDKILDEIDTSGLGPGFGTYDRKADEDLFPTSQAIQRALDERARPTRVTMPPESSRIAEATDALSRASAEYRRANTELDLARLTQSAEDIAYFNQHEAFRPGSDIARASEKLQEATEALQKAEAAYQAATRAAA